MALNNLIGDVDLQVKIDQKTMQDLILTGIIIAVFASLFNAVITKLVK